MMNRMAVVKELVAVAKLLAARGVLKCIDGGRVETMEGEARSADVKEGDLFTIQREDNHRYYGTLDIRGMGFRHDPGLSGRPTKPGVFDPRKMEFAVMKEQVGEGARRGFWAVWEEA
jgi:hypothetical protein